MLRDKLGVSGYTITDYAADFKEKYHPAIQAYIGYVQKLEETGSLNLYGDKRGVDGLRSVIDTIDTVVARTAGQEDNAVTKAFYAVVNAIPPVKKAVDSMRIDYLRLCCTNKAWG